MEVFLVPSIPAERTVLLNMSLIETDELTLSRGDFM